MKLPSLFQKFISEASKTSRNHFFKANQVLHQLIFNGAGKVTFGGHLYPLINKAKKKSNQVSYLVSIHLIFPLIVYKKTNEWYIE